jgi:glutathione peroxidase
MKLLLTVLYFIASANASSLYEFKVKNAEGKEQSLSDFKGKTLLIVNVASKCGYTSQYEGLQKLHQEYASRGLTILAFPSNEFGGQEPGSDQEIQKFCKTNYGVGFPVMAKVKVNGADALPLYAWLKANAPGKEKGAISWNFNKFLIDKEGRVVARYPSKVTPEQIENEIKGLL